MASAETDFGIRTVSGERSIVRVGEHPKVGQRDSSSVQTRVAQEAPSGASWARLKGGSGSLSAAAGVGSRWGRVTSTYRTPKHNRRVGGVRNSYHLSGRAIDIARRPGVSHAQIAAAFRNAGYQLIESLDEGDHSHFAFGRPGEYKRRSVAPRPQMVLAKAGEVTEWRIVYVGSAGGN